MKKMKITIAAFTCLPLLSSFLFVIQNKKENTPRAVLIPSEKFYFNSFVDCNMAEVWIGDTFRIFPGKYGQDPVWGAALDLKFADGKNADEVFLAGKDEFKNPILPASAKPTEKGLHGAVWFETIYPDEKDATGKLYTLFITTKITRQHCRIML
jgi:hypothetical protein